jgi:predicted oxidoreductase
MAHPSGPLPLIGSGRIERVRHALEAGQRWLGLQFRKHEHL